MKEPHGQGKVLVIVAAILALVAIATWVLVAMTSRIPITSQIAANNTHIARVVFLFGGFIMTWLFAIFLWNGVTAYLEKSYLSKLHPSMTFTIGAFATYVDLLALRSLDTIMHNNRIKWEVFTRPGVRLLDSLFLILIFGGFAWITGSLIAITERVDTTVRWNLRTYALTLVLVVVIGTVIVTVLVLLGNSGRI